MIRTTPKHLRWNRLLYFSFETTRWNSGNGLSKNLSVCKVRKYYHWFVTFWRSLFPTDITVNLVNPSAERVCPLRWPIYWERASVAHEPTLRHSNFNKKPNEVYAILLVNLIVALSTVFIEPLQAWFTFHVAFYKAAVVCRPTIL